MKIRNSRKPEGLLNGDFDSLSPNRIDRCATQHNHANVFFSATRLGKVLKGIIADY